MFINRFSRGTSLLLAVAFLLIAVFSVNAYLQQHREGTANIGLALDHTGHNHEAQPSDKQDALDAAGITDSQVLRALAHVRRATAKYHNVDAALADGFVQTPNCVESPEGGMGIHFIHPARLMDPAVNILEPEILLYLDSGNGLKLLGVEYWFSIGAPDTPIPDPAPSAPTIFGRPLDGPMDAHEPGQPPHYDLHVWVWKANPSGIFAPFNPNVSCE